MATKDEIAKGIDLLIQESHRLAKDLNEAQWENAVDLDGWKSKEVLAHIAGVGGLVVPMVSGLSSAPAGADALAAVDIDQLNAGLVGARSGKSAKDLADEVDASYRGVKEFVTKASDETLGQRVTARGYKEVPVSDILMRMVVLHGLGHIYSVYASIMNAG
jgi:hypothetical protein